MRRAFTLVELLAVLAIIGLMTALAVPAISSSLRATKLTTTGQAVMDELNLARQAAVSRNTPVEVRYYKLPDHGASASAPPDTYRAMQAFVVQGGTTSALGRPTMFPAPVVITSGTSESPLLASTNHLEQTPSLALPNVGTNYSYRAFRFSPNGSADLLSSENSLTLVLQKDKPLSQGANFFTVQVNTLNGSVRSFRP